MTSDRLEALNQSDQVDLERSLRPTLGRRSRRAMSESSEEVSLAQKQKHLKREQTSPTAHTPTPVASVDDRLDLMYPALLNLPLGN